MKINPRLYSILIVILFIKTAYTQKGHIDFNLVTGANGITLGKINGITQDKWGYIWFADQTQRRLTRYDGYRMKTYLHNPTDPTSIELGNMECIAADSSGNIWFPNNKGVDKFDPRTNVSTHYYFDSKSSCKGGYISQILVDHLGLIWVGTSEGLYNLDQKTGNFTCYSHHDNDPTSLSYNNVRALYEDHEGTLWVGTGFPFTPVKEKGGGLNKFDRKTGKFTRYLHNDEDPHSLINNKIRAIFEDSKGVFWIGTQGDGLHIMDRNTGKFERLTYDPSHPEKLSRPPLGKGDDYDHITFITEDHSGAIWIGTYHEGITRYDPYKKQLTRYKAEKSRQHGFTDSTTWCAFVSHEGAMWISIEGANVYRVDPLQMNFSKTFVNDFTWTFSEDSSHTVWGGLHTNAIVRIDRTSPDHETIKKYIVDPSLRANDLLVGGIYPLSKDIFLLATTKGIYVFDPKNERFTKAGPGYKGIGKDAAYSAILKDSIGEFISITKSNNGKIYLGGLGILALDSQTGELTRFKKNLADSTSLGIDIITTIQKDISGNIWIGGWQHSGMDLLDTKTNKFSHYLQGLTVYAIYQDPKETIWAGTELGLYRRKKNESDFTLFTSEQADLRTLSVTGLTGDQNGNIWGISSSGIIKIDPLTNEISFYGRRFGINELIPDSRQEAFRAHDGRIFFGAFIGYYSFDPTKVINNVPSEIILTGLKIDGHSITPGKNGPIQNAIEEATQIILKHDQNFFSIDFAAIHFSDPDNNVLQYKLDGYENTWRNVSQEKTAYYFNLPQGHYTFKIRAWTSYGLLSEKAVKVTVLPPWWQTWWAYTLYAILFITAIWVFISWRTRSLKKEKINLEQKVADRTKELREEKEIVESTLTELRSTQAQLIQSEKMASLGELTAGIAHEIQNPLNFVNNFSDVNKELIEELNVERLKPNAERDEQLENEILNDIKDNEQKINHHGKRAEAIVKGMLQHSRTSSGQKEPTDINALCDEYLRLSYHGLRAKDKSFNATMRTEFDETMGNINIIPQDIGRVILNLINNAFYAVNEKVKSETSNVKEDLSNVSPFTSHFEPIVTVTTKKRDNKIEIRVKDNGNGIPQKILDKIFLPFYTTKPTGQGTGLGLSMSYDIVKAHGGEIKVETKEGEGAEFYITLLV
ncbi:MAG TPA: two-component regulator propeller domain-containing protein [Chitinophagaceae bacterium]